MQEPQSTRELLFNDSVPIERIDNSLERKTEVIHVSVKLSKDRVLQLQLTSETDYTLLYSLEITFEEFQILKNEQNLLVDFLQFPLKFIELLKEVQKAHRQEIPKFICRLVSDNPKPAAFSIIETNSFRNIIHISLLFKPGNDAALKTYLASLVKEFKEKSILLQDTLQKTRADLDKKEKESKDVVENLSQELDKLKVKSQEQRNSLELEYTRKISDQKSEFLKEREEERVKKEVNVRDLELKYSDQVNKLSEKISLLKENNLNLSEKVSNLLNSLDLTEKEKSRLNLDLMTARREQERLSYSLEEVQRAKAGLEDVNSRLNSHVQKLEKRERDLSDSCRGSDERILSFQEKITRLEEEVQYHKSQNLKLEDNIKRASDEINKGNEIIRKLQSDVKSAKSKIKLKNTVTIQQEKLLEEKSESVGILQKEILEIKETAEKVRAENQNLLSKNGELEKKLEESKTIINDNNHVIEWLHKQLNEDALTRPYVSSSGPAVDFSKYTSNLGHSDIKRQSPPRFNRLSAASENRPPSNGSVYKSNLGPGPIERSANSGVASSPLPPNGVLYRGVNHLDGSMFSNPGTTNLGQTNYDNTLKNPLKPSVGIRILEQKLEAKIQALSGLCLNKYSAK